MNSWRDFWTATPARVWIYHFVLLPLPMTLYLLVVILNEALQLGIQAARTLCRDAFDGCVELAEYLSFSYREAMKQAKERGGVR